MIKFLAAALLLPSVLSADGPGWTPLLDADLTKWEVFIGIPHTTVGGIGDHPTSKTTP